MTLRTLCSTILVTMLALMGCEGTSAPGSDPEQVDAHSTLGGSTDAGSEPFLGSDEDATLLAADADGGDDLAQGDGADSDADDAEAGGGGPITRPPDPIDTDAGPDDSSPDTTTEDVGPPATCVDDSECEAAAPCTHGVCYQGDCIQVMHSEACDDGDPCTEGDQCVQGVCEGDVAACDDDDPCTVDDTCEDGVCGGTPVVCDDDNSCTNDVCYQGECKHLVNELTACALTVEIFEPVRAATLIAQATVTVVGQVNAPAGGLEELTINGDLVAISPSGTFVHDVTPRTGINVLVAEASDSFDRSARVVQAFAHGQAVLAPGSMAQPAILEGGLLAWLDRQVFDDDDVSDLDDIATLIHEVIDGFDLNAALPDPLLAQADKPSFGWCTWDVEVSDVSLDLEDIALYPVVDGLALKITFKDFYAWVAATAGGACPDAIGSATSDTITVRAALDVAIGPQGIDVDLTTMTVEIAEIELDIQEGIGQLFDWVINWFEDDLTLIVKEQIEAQVSQQVAPLLAGLLETVADFTYEFELPAIPPNDDTLPMKIVISPTQAVLTPDGLELELAGGFGVDKGINHSSPGSLIGGCVGVDSSSTGASCLGACGEEAPSGCRCDAGCVGTGECCVDYWTICGDAPATGLGECCGASTTAGCSANSACEGCICDADPYCCEFKWDAICATDAANACETACGCGSQCCQANPTADAGCIVDSCEDCVCGVDPYCCEFKWDAICATKAETQCDSACQCAETCCQQESPMGCASSSCEGCICALDDYCCETKWDSLCVNAAQDECVQACGCYAGDSALSGSPLSHDYPIELMAPEAIMNRFFFAVWWGGHMNINVDSAQLAESVGDLGLPGLSLAVDPHLAPIVTGCTDTGGYELQLGDVLMKASFVLLGAVQSVTFYASARVGVTLQLVQTDEGLNTIGIEVGEVIEAVAQLVDTSGDSPLLDNIDHTFIEGVLSELFISEYLTGVGASVPSKVIDLADYVTGLPSGSNVAFDPVHLEVLGAAAVLGGQIAAVP
jgi:hypothetical protein